MEAKEITFEDMKDLKPGDMIVMKDPLVGDGVPYVFINSAEGKYYFMSSLGASLMVSEQETIDAFEVKLIDKEHSSWDPVMSEQGEQLGTFLSDTFKKWEEQGLA